jgi:hypothetical protein
LGETGVWLESTSIPRVSGFATWKPNVAAIQHIQQAFGPERLLTAGKGRPGG